MHLLVADVPSVDVVDATRVAGGAAGPVAHAGCDLLVGFYRRAGLLGVAVCGERGEGEGEEGGNSELHDGSMGGRMDGW